MRLPTYAVDKERSCVNWCWISTFHWWAYAFSRFGLAYQPALPKGVGTGEWRSAGLVRLLDTHKRIGHRVISRLSELAIGQVPMDCWNVCITPVYVSKVMP